MNEAFNFLLDDEFDKEYNEEIVSKIKEFKEQITGVNFQSEEVRKAVQLCLLRGYKHANESNALITPDTIGIFISYLIQKLYGTKEIQTIFDPLIGTGNLLYTVANNLNKDVKVFGVDNDMLNVPYGRVKTSDWPNSDGIADLFAYGKPKIMDYYSTCLFFMMEHINNGHYMVPHEHFLHTHLNKVSIPVRFMDTNLRITRTSKK